MERVDIKTREDIENFIEEYIEDGRSGVINLPCPMLNIAEWKANPSFYNLLLGLTEDEFESFAYFGSLWNDGADKEGKEKKEHEGAEAIKKMLEGLDVDKGLEDARSKEIVLMQQKGKLFDLYDELGGEEAERAASQKLAAGIDEEGGDFAPSLTEEEQAVLDASKSIDDICSRLEETRCLLTALRRFKMYGTEKLVINEIKLFPVYVRGLLKEAWKETPYAVYDIELHYSRIRARCERLSKLMDLGAPDVIIRAEKRVLQEYIDALVWNGARGTYLGGRKEGCALASLHDLMMRSEDLL